MIEEFLLDFLLFHSKLLDHEIIDQNPPLNLGLCVTFNVASKVNRTTFCPFPSQIDLNLTHFLRLTLSLKFVDLFKWRHWHNHSILYKTSLECHLKRTQFNLIAFFHISSCYNTIRVILVPHYYVSYSIPWRTTCHSLLILKFDSPLQSYR